MKLAGRIKRKQFFTQSIIYRSPCQNVALCYLNQLVGMFTENLCILLNFFLISVLCSFNQNEKRHICFQKGIWNMVHNSFAKLRMEINTIVVYQNKLFSVTALRTNTLSAILPPRQPCMFIKLKSLTKHMAMLISQINITLKCFILSKNFLSQGISSWFNNDKSCHGIAVASKQSFHQVCSKTIEKSDFF